MTGLRNGVAKRLRGRGRAAVSWAAVAMALAGQLVLSGPATADTDVRDEVECLALTIYFEARGEPDEGKLAVGHVVMNRASHPRFPGAVCDVVKQGGEEILYRCQFTWWCDGLSDRPSEWQAWRKSMAFARSVYWDYSTDPTGGALWYHAESVQPIWRLGLALGAKIGGHFFYREKDTRLDRAVALSAPIRLASD